MRFLILLLFAVPAQSEYKMNPYTNQRDYYEGTAALKTSTTSLQVQITSIVTGIGGATAGDFKWKISQSSACGSGWLRADGSNKSTTTYSGLFAQLGYMFGGSGANFTLPNMNNGEFIRALSTGTQGGNLSSNMGTKQPEMVGSHTHALRRRSGSVGTGAYGLVIFTTAQSDGATDVNTGTENRPVNYAMIPCIYSGIP